MKNKFASTLAVAFIGLAAMSAKSAYSGDLACADWSFNNPGCSAHVEWTNKAPTSAPRDNKQLASCADWSFNTPDCSANIEKSNSTPISTASAAGPFSQLQLACSDWSFNTPGCSAHVN